MIQLYSSWIQLATCIRMHMFNVHVGDRPLCCIHGIDTNKVQVFYFIFVLFFFVFRMCFVGLANYIWASCVIAATRAQLLRTFIWLCSSRKYPRWITTTNGPMNIRVHAKPLAMPLDSTFTIIHAYCPEYHEWIKSALNVWMAQRREIRVISKVR